MSILLSILGAAADLIQWFIGYGQRQIGKEQQQNVDLKKDNQILENELAAANQPVDAADSLRKHEF